jgi:hypothetical protein
MKLTTASMRRRPPPCPLPCRATGDLGGRSPPPSLNGSLPLAGYVLLHVCSDFHFFKFAGFHICFSASSERTVEPCKHAASHGAVEQRFSQAPAPMAPFSAKVQDSCTLLTTRNGVNSFRALTGFICKFAAVCQNLPDLRRSYAVAAGGSGHQGPRDQRPNASPNHRVSLENDVRSNTVLAFTILLRRRGAFLLNKLLLNKSRQVRQLQLHLYQERSIRVMLDRAIGRASSTLSPGHRHFPAQV